MLRRLKTSRALNSLKSASASQSSVVLLDHQNQVLEACVAEIRLDIFKLQAHHASLLSNLLTIGRCLRCILPPMFLYEACPIPVIARGSEGMDAYEDEDEDSSLDLISAIENFAKVWLKDLQSLQQGTTRINWQSSKSTPVFWGSQGDSDCERFIPPPTSLKDRDYPPGTKTELRMLVLNKAELLVRIDQLEGELEFWVGLWGDIKSCSMGTKNEVWNCRRKEVPIGEMLDRMRENIGCQSEKKRDEIRHDSGVGMLGDTIAELE